MPTPQESAEHEHQRVEQAEVQLEQQRQRTEQLVARLRAMGVDLEEH